MISLATFKPTKFLDFIIEDDERDWKELWISLRRQEDLFHNSTENAKRMIPKLPYKFYYVFEDDSGKKSKMMIEDWEIGQLYWNCLKRSKGNTEVALEKVRMKYWDTFVFKCDTYLFLGTTKQRHFTARNPFLIIGVFYPKLDQQIDIFDDSEEIKQ